MINWYFYCLKSKKPRDKSVAYCISRFRLTGADDFVLEEYIIREDVSSRKKEKVVAEINKFLADKKLEDKGLVEKVTEMLKEEGVLEEN